MKNNKAARITCLLAAMLVARSLLAVESGFTEADARSIKGFLKDNFVGTNVGMVVGLLDEHGSKIFSSGVLDNGTDQEVNGDTVFEIGSITKTFTALTLMDLVEHGKMKLDEPVANFLPATVKVPAQGGKTITLLNLAAQDSGLPFNATNFSGADWKEQYDSYTVEKMYAFLSGYALAEAPGTKFQYSNLGMSLLGHVMEVRTHTNFESLVLDRICRPLHMDDTGITLRPELKARLATGHSDKGKRVPTYDLQVMAGAGALRSTANDLLKYVAANLGYTNSQLKPLMEKMQVVRHTNSADFGKTAMPWYDQGVYNPPGTELLGHGGGTGGAATFIGFDKKQRRGVVVLSNQTYCHSSTVGWAILQQMPLTKESGQEFVREIVGLGSALGLDQKTGTLKITKVFRNSPAGRAGLSAGMLVQKINGVATSGKSLPECMTLIRGGEGSKVRMEVIDPKLKETNTVEVVRQKFLTYNG